MLETSAVSLDRFNRNLSVVDMKSALQITVVDPLAVMLQHGHKNRLGSKGVNSKVVNHLLLMVSVVITEGKNNSSEISGD